jgi:PAS domain-containing protein
LQRRPSAIVFTIAASWEFLAADFVLPTLFGIAVDETSAERWRFVVLATLWASIALAVLCPFALRINLERNRALDEVERQARELQQALGREHDRFAVALQNMRQGLAIYDAEQRLVDCNDRFASLYGLSPDSVKPGMSLKEMVDLRIANGVYAGDDPDAYLAERLDWASRRKRERKVHHLNNGRIIEITRETLPDGGWMALHEDITERMDA